MNRLIQKSYNDGVTATVQYGYDAVPPTNCAPSLTMTYPIGRRTAMCDAAGNEAWSYDKMGRAVTDQRTTNGLTKSTGYGYNLDGSLSTLTYPSQRIVTYTPNAARQSVSAVDTTYNINYATGAMYYPNGALRSMTNGTALVSDYFNSRLQPCRFAVNTSGAAPGSCADTNKGNVLDLTYNFGLGADNGNVLGITNNITVGRSLTASYDMLNRIETAYTSTWSEQYGLDLWGNLTSITAMPGKPAGENLSQSATTQNRFAGMSYDAAGNLLNDGTTAYGFDAESRIKTAGTATYTYDGDGKRVEKSTSSGVYKIYWYGMNSDPLDETDGTGSLTNSSFNEYVFFNGSRIARRDSSGNVFYYFADHLGTSREIVQAGQTLPCYDADFFPFGRESTVYTNTCPQNYKFTGKERDETGLDNFGARYNSSQYGRFMTPDSPSYSNHKNPQTWNLYAHSLNNPVTFRDSNGHKIDCANNTQQCLADAAASTANAQAAARVTTQTTEHGWWIFKWSETSIKITGNIDSFRALSPNAAKLADLVTSNQTVTVTYDRFANVSFNFTMDTHGGSTSLLPSQRYTGDARAWIDPANHDYNGISYDPDAIKQGIPEANTSEEFGHEVLGHIWGELINGDLAGTRANMRDSIIGENAVRALDPTRGQKGLESHHDMPSQ